MINQITIIGRISKDIELKQVNDYSIANFTIANTTGYGDKKKTNWLDCTAFRALADVIGKFTHKGSLIAITGELQTNQYKDKDGNNRAKTFILVNGIQLLDQKKKEEKEEVEEYDIKAEIDDEELPF